MTEYDFSPGAYERYIAKQQEIARWVDNTRKYSVLPAETTTGIHNPLYGQSPRALDYYQDSPLSHASDSDHERPSSSRRHREHRHKHGKRDDRDYRSHRSRHSHSHHRDHTKGSRSSSAPPISYTQLPYSVPPTYNYPTYTQQYQYPNVPAAYPNPNPQQYHYPATTSYPYQTPQHPTSPYSNTTNGAYTPNSLVPVLTPVPGGYVLASPPQGLSYQVIQNSGQYTAPAPNPSQPWYKRVFSPPTSVSDGKSKIHKSSNSSSQKRSNKWGFDIY